MKFSLAAIFGTAVSTIFLHLIVAADLPPQKETSPESASDDIRINGLSTRSVRGVDDENYERKRRRQPIENTENNLPLPLPRPRPRPQSSPQSRPHSRPQSISRPRPSPRPRPRPNSRPRPRPPAASRPRPESTPRPTKKRSKQTRAPTPFNYDSNDPTTPTSDTENDDGEASIATVCPPPGSNPMPIPPGPVVLEWSSTLCVLIKGQRSGGDGDDGEDITLTKMAPVARSYDNLPWRKSGGGFAERMLYGIDFVDVDDKTFDGIISEKSVNQKEMEFGRERRNLRRFLNDNNGTIGKRSTIVLPPLNEEIGEGYYLMSFEHEISEIDKIARFLNRATFGATRDEIDNFPTSKLTTQSAAQWIQSQIDEPSTSHRAWFRKRLNARSTRPDIKFIPDHPCHMGSRWRRYTFSKKDGHQWWNTEGRTIRVTGDGPYVITFAGHARTTVETFPWKNEFPKITIDPSMEYSIACWDFPEEWIGGTWNMRAGPGMYCRPVSNPPIYFDTNATQLANPVVPLPAVGSGGLEVIDLQKNESSGQEFILLNGLDHDVCTQLPDILYEDDPPVFGQTPDGMWLQFDPRYDVEENTAENPLRDGGGTRTLISNGLAQCSNVRRNVFNEHGCILSSEPTTCKGTSDNLFIPIVLSAENIVAIHEITGTYPYAVMNLPLGGDDNAPIVSPCKKGTKTRWMILPEGECVQTDMDTQTYNVLSSVLRQTQDDNSFIRDIVFPANGASCSAEYADSLEEVSIIMGNQCFKRVHPEHLSVFDLTLCTREENPCTLDLSNGDHPVKSPLDNDGNAFFDYQGQDNVFWDDQLSRLTKIGRLGDTIMFKDLPNNMRLAKVAERFNDKTSQGQSHVVVCGSRNEVANDPSLGDFGFEIIEHFQNVAINPAAHRESVFFMIALEARDQLRQLMAWQLSQLFAIVPLVLTGGWDHTENFLNYYDIFVRHGLGNFVNILREVTFNPLMAENLTFQDSKSGSYLFETTGSYTHADENYARELMQLFTIGVFLLNEDGTKMLNEYGEPIPTFSNDEVMSFARVFTGFVQSQPRGNFEENDPSLNALDELIVDPIYHDKFPKHDLTGGYIGDGYPLCVDLPSRMFLRKGATYRLLGDSPRPHAFINEGTNDGQARVFELGENSRLKEILCNSVDGSCQFQMTVTLDSNIECDTKECQVDEARVLKVHDVYYEYIRPPCVEQVFFNDSKKVTYKNSFRHSSCANPLLPHAAEACCTEGNGGTLTATRYKEYVFDHERVTFSAANVRCSRDGLSQCDFNFVEGDGVVGLHWTNSACEIAIKVNPEGKVAIVYEAMANIIHPNVHEDNMNYFKVYWNGDFPRNSLDENGGNTCGNGECTPLDDGGCFCYIEVDEEAVFSKMPRPEEVLSKLYIGAYDPLAYDKDMFSKEFGEGVIAYLAGGAYSSSTVFEVEDSFGRVRLMKNSIETVRVKNSEYSFRNAPSFLSLLNEESAERDALNEVDALVDHLLYHQNTAPFIASRLIQRFATSNPDPIYVSSVAKSFRTGKYGSLGSGKYGDLAATVSAILLDPGSQSAVLDADPYHGSIREPLTKALHVLRSMEIKLENGKKVLENHFPFTERIFQMAHSFPSVFSFFLPENIPSGRPGEAELTSPEAMLTDMPKIINMLNGLFSTIKYGVSRCNNGFGRGDNESNCQEGNFTDAAARLSFDSQFSDANDVVTELSTLLTGGRLGAQNKQIVIEAYRSKLPDKEAGMRIAQQLIISSPEFQSSNTVLKNGQPRLPVADPQPKGVPYKAVVYIMLTGGADSFNMLVPMRCSTYYDYIRIRRGVEQRTNSLLKLDATESNQTCSFYGLHSKLKTAEQLYNNRDLLFFANAGVLTKPTDKDNYAKDTLSRLFAHNHMQREIQHLDPHLVDARTGVLGRMSDALTREGMKVHRFNIHDRAEGLEGNFRPDPFIVDASGIPLFNENPSTTDMLEDIKKLNEETKQESNVFADLWSDSLLSAMTSNGFLTSALANVTISSSFGDDHLGKGMEMIVKLIATREVRKVDRDFFFISMNGWDAHKLLDNNLNKNLETFDKALESFVTEMRLMGVWENVTILQASEFGRTLEANSVRGTDHGWGGNYMMMGGSVKGRRILGKYPEFLNSNAPEILDRGRVLPTTSWDVILSAIAEWTGVPPEALSDVCPNLDNFPKSDWFDVRDLFHAV